MQTINISEARKRLPELIQKTYFDSTTYLITKGGIPMAKIVSTSGSTEKSKRVKKVNIKKAISAAQKIDGVWNDPEWKDKSTVEIAGYIRNKAWHSHAH